MFEDSLQLAKNAYTVIKAAIGTDTISECDRLTKPARSKHIELDFRPCVHTDSRLVVDLPVYHPELRAQVSKVVGGTIAPEPLFVKKAKLITQMDINLLQAI